MIETFKRKNKGRDRRFFLERLQQKKKNLNSIRIFRYAFFVNLVGIYFFIFSVFHLCYDKEVVSRLFIRKIKFYVPLCSMLNMCIAFFDTSYLFDFNNLLNTRLVMGYYLHLLNYVVLHIFVYRHIFVYNLLLGNYKVCL